MIVHTVVKQLGFFVQECHVPPYYLIRTPDNMYV